MDDDEVNLVSLLKNLVECSEKAARIAQICRSDPELFSLLIQEKKDGEKNMRFVHDFKTLADVLVQETLRWNISKQFPQLCSNIFGEENNHFENTLGESVDVKVCDSPAETIKLLASVLDGRHECSVALCEGIYEDILRSIDASEGASEVVLPGKSIGVWIDPIDCTGEYIHGSATDPDEPFASKGLQCVCVVIGVFDLESGYPIAGVVNQPFFSYDGGSGRWQSKYYWALCHGDIRETSLKLPPKAKEQKKIAVSSSENDNLMKVMASKYSIYRVSGSGYKALLVACAKVDLYVLSHPTTFFWDTCGPNALLAAIGGGIVDYKKVVAADKLSPDDLSSYQLKYKSSPDCCGKPFCNTGGVIAYRDADSLLEFLQLLRVNNLHIQQ